MNRFKKPEGFDKELKMYEWMKQEKFEFNKNSIMDGKDIVMHDWEDRMMKKHAEVVCQNGGDILELGFGMGISAGHIQQQDIKSHTIIEKDKDVHKRLCKWAEDKPNVKIIFGDWYDNLPDEKFDGVFFDTYNDINRMFLPLRLLSVFKETTIVSWFNTYLAEDNIYSKSLLQNSSVKYHKVNIKIPEYVDYFLKEYKDEYFVPEWSIGENDTKEKYMKILHKMRK